MRDAISLALAQRHPFPLSPADVRIDAVEVRSTGKPDQPKPARVLMPTLIIKTNAEIPASAAEPIIKRASAQVAELLGKPERYVMVILEPTPAMCFGGNTSPLAFLELKSLGLPEQRTPELSAALCALLQDALGISPDRVYIEFASPPRHLFGFDSKTF